MTVTSDDQFIHRILLFNTKKNSFTLFTFFPLEKSVAPPLCLKDALSQVGFQKTKKLQTDYDDDIQ